MSVLECFIILYQDVFFANVANDLLILVKVNMIKDDGNVLHFTNPKGICHCIYRYCIVFLKLEDYTLKVNLHAYPLYITDALITEQ